MLSIAFALLTLLTQDGTRSTDVITSNVATNTPAVSEIVKESTKASAPTAAQEWTLRYQFKSDQNFRYETHQIMTLDARIGANRKVDVSELKQRRVFTVLSTEESGVTQLAMQFEHVWMKMQSDDKEAVVFDSAMKADEVPVVFRNTAHQLKGSAPKYRLSNRGISLVEAKKVERIATEVKVTEPKNSADHATSGLSEPVPGKSIQLAAGTVTGERTIAEKTADETDPGSFLMLLPEQPVSIGDTWKETNTVSVRLTQDINRKVSILRTFRLESVDNGIATVSFRSSIETQVKGPNVLSQLIQATPRGTLQFDIAQGVMLRRELQFNETVIGAFGRESVLSSVGTNTELLIEAEASPPANAACAESVDHEVN